MGSQLQTSEETKLVIGLLVACAMVGSYSIVEAQVKPLKLTTDHASEGEGADAKEEEKECAKEGEDCFFVMNEDSEGNPRCCSGFGCDGNTLKCKECAGLGEDCTRKKCCPPEGPEFLICEAESMESKTKTCRGAALAK